MEYLPCRIGELTDLHLERYVPNMVQTKWYQRTLNQTVDAKGDNRVLISRPLREGLDRGSDRRPNKGQHNAQENGSQTRNDRNKTFTGKETQIFREFNTVETVEHIGRNRARDDPTQHTSIG